MKYTQYLQLREIILMEQYDLFINLGIDDVLNEDDTLDTEKGNIVTRRGRLKSKLNKAALKLQNQINTKIVDKYMTIILNGEEETINMLKQLENKKTPIDQIKKIIAKNIEKNSKIQSQQLDLIERTIETYMQNAIFRLNGVIAKSRMKERNKEDIRNYWLLLQTQIKMNILASMKKAITNKTSEFLSSDTAGRDTYFKAKKEVSNNFDKDLENTYNETKQQAETKKQEILNTEDESNDEDIKIGDKFKVLNTTAGDLILTVIKIDGDTVYAKDETGKTWNIQKDQLINNGFKLSKSESQSPSNEGPKKGLI